jgi:hypothetical protein
VDGWWTPQTLEVSRVGDPASCRLLSRDRREGALVECLLCRSQLAQSAREQRRPSSCPARRSCCVHGTLNDLSADRPSTGLRCSCSLSSNSSGVIPVALSLQAEVPRGATAGLTDFPVSHPSSVWFRGRPIRDDRQREFVGHYFGNGDEDSLPVRKHIEGRRVRVVESLHQALRREEGSP